MKTFRLLSRFPTFALALIASHLGASPVVILPAGSAWRYQADGTDQGTAWRAVSFNDASWNTGPAQLGFGDGDEVTVIQSGAVTVYFRRTFQSQVADPASLTLRLLRDDGAVVYINGIEVFRSNMPPGPVSYNTLASAAVGGAQETTEFVTASIDPGVLVAGPNVVAVEVHQVNLTSSDLSFDLELIAEAGPPPPVNQRPYVQLNEPQNGDVFTAPTNIVLRAFAHDQEDGYQLRVEFFAGTNSLGLGEFVATTCPAPYCPFYQLVWSNVPPGSHTLIARATDSSGASSNSAPVSITVQPSDPGTNVTLIAMGSVWKYLDNGSDQGSAWRALEFNDSTWASGPAQLGYGDGDEATVVSFGPDPMNKYITTYFRRSFNVANAAAFSLLRGRLLQDDGAAVYLNGVEIFRSNLPPGPILFNTPASSVSPENQIVEFSAPASLLVSGVNVVAVEMHQVNVTSSDLSFDLELLGERSSTPPNETPYVQLNEPRDGDIFTAPANILLRAYAEDREDGYDLTVEFFAGGQNLGFGTFVPARCATPYCPYYELTWSNVPPGNYTLTARATDSSGASSNSAPVLISVIASNVVCAPQLEWQQAFGGTGAETLYGIQQTSDGGYLLGGTSASPPSGNKTSPFLGGNQFVGDMWLVRLDAAGNKLWDKSFGGTGSEHLVVVLETRDGGIALAGASDSGISGNKSTPNFGGNDFWLVRLDANGNKLWDRSFGGTQPDFLWRMKETADGGFILGGYSGSGANGNKESPAYGSYADYWIVRVDAAGNKLWDRSFGGESRDELRGLALTPDGGFLLGGLTVSTNGTRTSQHFGGEDFWVVRVDADGHELWQASFGGSQADQLFDLTATADGGFALVGLSNSNTDGNKTSPNLGPAGTDYPTFDFWAVRLDAGGNKLWDRTFGGARSEVPYSIREMADGGFVAGGYSDSQPSGNKTSPAYGSHDFWVVRMDAQGNPLWDVSFGGSNSDPLLALEKTFDGGFIMGGQSHSGADGNKTVPSFGFSDYWVVKLGPDRCDTNLPPQVRITSPADGAEFDAAAHVRIEAVTSDPDGYASTVEFFANAHKIGEASVVFIQPPPPGEPIYFEFTWTNPPVGQHRLTARTVDNQGARGESSAVNITVREGGPVVGPAPDDQEHPAVAGDGVNFLVVWMDRRNGLSEYDIYGARVSASGQVLDPAGIPICTAPTSQWYPSVAFDGNNFLVVWADGRAHSNDNPRLDIFGARVSSAGTILDPNGIQITHGEVVGQPTVAFNGTDYLVAGYAWEHNAVRRTTLLGVRVTPSGEVRDHEELILNQSDSVEYPAVVASVGGDWLVVWNGTGVEGARVSPAGNVTPLSTVLQQGFVAINGLAAGSSNYFLTTMDNRQLTEDTYVQDIFGTWISRDGRALRTILIAANTNRSIGSAGGQPTTFKQEHPTAAFNGSELMVVWDAGDMYYNGGNNMFRSDIRAARIDAGGNVSPVISVCDAPQNQSQPAIAFNGQQFLTVWQDARTAPPQEYYPLHHFDIYGARLTPPGSVLEHNGLLISGARPNQPPVVAITSPASGSVFDTDARIFIEATATDPDGEVRTVEFFANGQSIYGRPTDPFYLYWLQPPPGEYVLTARATDNSGASSVSEPVNITVREQPTSGRELHAVGIHNGRTADGVVTQQNGHAAVVVNRPGKQVTLFLSAYWPVRWHVTVGDGTVIEKVILAGYEAQTIEGINTNVPVQRLYGSSQYLIEYDIDSIEFQQVQARLCALTGMDMSSFHGSLEAPYPAPFVIDAVQDDPRLRCDYPQPVDPSELPNLSFRLSFHDGSSGNVVHQDYTLAGPQNALRLLPAYRVVSDGGGRFYYAAERQEVWRVDTGTGAVQGMDFGPNVPELSWPMGVAFDSQRNRVLVVSLGGEGYLYGYSPAQGQWSVVSSMNNRDLDCLVYHPADDSLYGLAPTYNGPPYLMRFTANGVFQSQIVLPVQPFRIDYSGFKAELASAGDYLVLLLETDPFYSYDIHRHEARMYLIDPRTGEHWLAYRRVAGFDTDRDGVPDERDYCPNTPLYATVDSNGCSADQRDSDNDGVPDSGDECLGTAPGVVVNSRGCSLAQLCPCDGPWRNHREYVTCVIRHAWEFFREGLISRDQRRDIIRDAVRSACGRHPDRREPVCMHLFPLTREECQRDGLQFVLSGDASGTCTLECSEDLVNWRSVEPVSIAGWEITCPLESGTNARFYRVHVDE